MDRNLWWGVRKAVGSLVALRKESVDRNYIIKITVFRPAASLSARRAWIEITGTMGKSNRAIVALRKESVDRNLVRSSNRTIDIIVALRKESVDRNSCWLLA